jgi:hypothetical protein
MLKFIDDFFCELEGKSTKTTNNTSKGMTRSDAQGIAMLHEKFIKEQYEKGTTAKETAKKVLERSLVKETKPEPKKNNAISEAEAEADKILNSLKGFDDDFKLSKLSKIKKGEYFRFVGKKMIYTYDGKDRKYGFHYIPNNDVWGGGKYTKTDRAIEIGFTY